MSKESLFRHAPDIVPQKLGRDMRIPDLIAALVADVPEAERAADRKAQVGSGDRSERIRTYNFPQGRVTDHRINLTLYKLDEILSGNLDMLIDPLLQEQQAELLAEVTA